ncbi:CU044_2847 family protein [Acrocarpospora phusangensis]|nr:CU044_2847 family protein [Acrocarpospora phusangensis]
MGDFVEVPLPDGTVLIVEAADQPRVGGVVAAGRLHDVASAATESFEMAVTRLQSAAGAIVGRMSGMVQPPSEVTVEFGVKLATAAGVVIASTSAEANLKVVLRWTNDTRVQITAEEEQPNPEAG